ncbi:serine/threonine-protein kinase [Actinoplanes sp. CA-142083]|uniref:serine/threonine-protein kinase n=1 Tax=Actinoplanes sp. CA-142083 TaxID=3239903 RepID=UPI003D8AF084
MRTGAIVAGRYRLVQPLGAGGLGRVWLAHDEADRRQVAIKKTALPDDLAPDERDLFLDWTVREARALSSVGHPNVVRTYDVLPDADAPWIVMEYVPSRSLQQIIDESGPLPPARVAGIGLAVLDALLAVRRAGLLHLDVKPSNVLIADDGRVVLTDFGPAVTDDGLRALAAAGIVLGSPKYLAPERMDGLALPESDLWSLGATLYHAVEGRPPFARPTLDDTLMAIAEDPPDPARLAGPLCPVLEGLLRPDPADRLPAGDVGAELSAVVLGQDEPRAAIGWPSRSRLRHAALVALLVLVLATVTVLADGHGA